MSIATKDHTLQTNNKKFVAILNKRAELGMQLNALAHLSLSIGTLSKTQGESPSFVDYVDHSDVTHPNISDHPFVVLKAHNSTKLRELRQKFESLDLPVTDFTHLMAQGDTRQSMALTTETEEEDLTYLGICTFAEADVVDQLTCQFSAYQ